MQPPSLQQVIPILQLAVGPVILISGIGLLLLSMTNRFGRTIDRARDLAAMRRADSSRLEAIETQITVIVRRARVLRMAIILASVSVLLAAVLIIVLFVTALLHIEAAWALALLFTGCLLAVIGSLLFFIQDLNLSLHALRAELSGERGVDSFRP